MDYNVTTGVGETICPHFDERRDEHIYEIAEKSTQQQLDSNMTKNTRTR